MDIETMAVTAVESIVAKTDNLVPRIPKRDKDPSWDGHIEVYHIIKKNGKIVSSYKKENLILNVPVQVKGHVAKNLKKKKVTFSMEIADIRNYLYVGGTIFFVVYMDGEAEKSKIYYVALLPYDLKRILKKYGNQKKKSLELKEFPTNKTEISNLLLCFARDMNKQKPAISCDAVTLDELKEFGEKPEVTFGYSLIPPNDPIPLDYMLNHGVYLYAKLSHGLKLPVEYIKSIDIVGTTIQADVCVNGKHFYEQYSVEHKKETIEIRFGKSCVHITRRENHEQQQFSYKPTGTLSEQIRDEEFFLEAIAAGGFTVNEVFCPLQTSAKEYEQLHIPRTCEHLEWMKTVKETLDKLRVHEELDCSKLTEKDEDNLRMLVTAVLEGKTVRLSNTKNGFPRIYIANLTIILCVICRDAEKQLYNVYDFNDPPIKLFDTGPNEVKMETTPYILLKKDDILQFSNLDYGNMVNSLKSLPLTDKYSSRVLGLLLNLLSAYDESEKKDAILLDAAIEIADWLNKNDPHLTDNIGTLNYFQAIKRKRPLEKEERQQLRMLVESKPEYESTYVGAYLLLDDLEAARVHYECMDEKEQESFQHFPICYFSKQDDLSVEIKRK